MTIDYKIKMIDDLISENRESTIKDFCDLVNDIEEIERQVMIDRISKVDYSKIDLKSFQKRTVAFAL